TPVVGVVDDGGEEVGGGDDGEAVADPYDGSVVTIVQPDEEPGRRLGGKRGDDLLQLAGRDLAGTATAVGVLREANRRGGHSPSIPPAQAGEARGGRRGLEVLDDVAARLLRRLVADVREA